MEYVKNVTTTKFLANLKTSFNTNSCMSSGNLVKTQAVEFAKSNIEKTDELPSLRATTVLGLT